MNTNYTPNPVNAYFDGMLWAAYGVKLFGDKIEEWKMDAVKESALHLKEVEIDHSSFSQQEKAKLKQQWKQGLDAYAQGFKDVLKRGGLLL